MTPAHVPARAFPFRCFAHRFNAWHTRFTRGSGSSGSRYWRRGSMV